VIVNEAVAVQLSKDCARTNARTSGTVALQLVSAVALCDATAAQFTVGAVASLTVRVAVQVAEFPEQSVAVNVIVVIPRPTSVPPLGL
jgi:hypothetical protein